MNEEQVTQELCNGNLEIFPQFVDIFKNRIFAMAYKFTNDYVEAQDLSQDIFLKMYRQIGSFRFESKLSTWVYRVAMNTCLDWKKKNRRVKVINFTSMARDEEERPVNSIKDDGPLPDEKMIAIEEQGKIHQAIYSLPDIYKTVIIMFHFNNMSYLDIAKALDIPEKTVETRLYRARRKLKEELGKFKDGGVAQWTAKKF